MDEYSELLNLYKDYAIFSSINNVLSYDMQCFMPNKGNEVRGNQMSMLAGMSYDKISNPRIGELIQELEKADKKVKLHEKQKRNVYLIKREYDKAVKIPKEFVIEKAKQNVQAFNTWREAKQTNNWSIFAPELQKNVELAQQESKYIDPSKHPYDVAIDNFEPGMTKEEIARIFTDLKAELIQLLTKIKTKKAPNTDCLFSLVAIETQKKWSKTIAQLLGYQLGDRGRIDEAEHPFTDGFNHNDVRITTHYYEKDYTNALYSTAHESGHGIYEQNLPEEEEFTPIGVAASMAIHESQSRFFENIISRSRAFWEANIQKFENFPESDIDEFIHAINLVTPSKIRIEADEVTYCLHIILRFEIEKGLMEGSMKVEDLPAIWNNKMKEYLGVTVENDTEGVLQDVHWSGGSFGYFPSYALGNIISGQILHTIQKEFSIVEAIEKGELSKVKEWLTQNLYSKGSLYDPFELVKVVTGEELTSKYYINYLTEKYTELYRL